MHTRLLLLALVCATPLHAEPPPPPVGPPPAVTVSGSYRLRPEYFSHVDFQSDRADVLLRLRPDLTWRPGPELSIFFQPQAAKSFGEPIVTVTAPGVTRTQDTSGPFNGDSTLTFHQAYVDYRPRDGVTLRLGRQTLSYGDELLIGAADWANVARSFDALRMMVDWGDGSVDLFTTKLRDTNVNASGPGDRDLHGLYVAWKFPTWLGQLDGYAFDRRDASAAGVRPATLVTTGARARGVIGRFDYRVEGTRQRGFNTASGTQYTPEVGVTVTPLGRKTRLAVEYFEASRDFDQLYPSGHRWLGMGDELARRNVRGFGAHLAAEPRDRIEIKLDFFDFSRVDRDGAMYRIDGTTPLGSAGGSDAGDVGREFDLLIKFKADPHLTWSLGYSKFWSGAYFADQLNKKNPEFGYAQLEASF